jgi:RHS repeat-associated protein
VSLDDYLPGGAPAADTWYEVSIPLADLDAEATTTNGFYIQPATTGTIYVDDVKLTPAGTGASAISYIHPDHLGSTNAVTNDDGSEILQTIDYYPYGAERIATGDSPNNRHYIGEYFDDSTDLSYLNARYYNGSKGRFISQDPVFWEVGTSKLSELFSKSDNAKDDGAISRSKEEQNRIALKGYLSDPQLQNSYSYARNNPARLKDPEGLWYKEFATGQQSWSSLQLELGEAANQLAQDSAAWNYAFENPVRSGAVVGAGSGFAAYSAAGGIVVGAGFNATNAIVGGLNAYGWGQTAQSYLQYKATGSQVDRSQVRFDGIVSAVALLGTAQQRQALNMLSAALTVLSADLKNMNSNQSNGGGNNVNAANTQNKSKNK